MNLLTALVGPLAGPECRRALGRGWLILVRTAAGLAVGTVALTALWYWWISQGIDAGHRPYEELRVALGVIEVMLLTVALVLGPAVLAGSLAGEKERGVLALLLTTRVRSREVVAGRLAGKLAQVGMILLAGLPALVLVGALAGLGPSTLFVTALLPSAVAVGGGGIAAVASTVSRRGRDALLAVYLVDLFLMLTPLIGGFGASPWWDWLGTLNPYSTLAPLVGRDATAPAWASIGFWLAIGLLGGSLASWRLRPSCLAPLDGERVARKSAKRGVVPPVDERRPMLWKELFIERVATLGRFGRWAGLLLILGLGAGSVALAGVYFWNAFYPGSPEWADWSKAQMMRWYGDSGFWVSCLLQWAIGLRAAVSISSERERGTWDALLTSPLDGAEIVRGKLWGSLYAIRWLTLAAFVAWTLTAATGAAPLSGPVTWGIGVLVSGAFIAAVGVRTSLASPTATRAMSLTIGIWLAAYVGVAFLTVVILATGTLLCNSTWILLANFGLAPPVTTFWFPMPMYLAWPLAWNALYLGFTLAIVADTRLRFDRIAGRMTEGKVAVAFEELVYGRPMGPVPLDPDAPPAGLATPARDEPAGDPRFEDRVAGSA